MYCDLRCSIRGCALVCFADDPTAKKRDDRCLMTFREGEVLRKMPVRFDQKVAGHQSLTVTQVRFESKSWMCVHGQPPTTHLHQEVLYCSRFPELNVEL